MRAVHSCNSWFEICFRTLDFYMEIELRFSPDVIYDLSVFFQADKLTPEQIAGKGYF